jgi:hypothetical protein
MYNDRMYRARQTRKTACNFKHTMTVHHSQEVQQVQLTSTQSAAKYSDNWSELQNGIVPTN